MIISIKDPIFSGHCLVIIKIFVAKALLVMYFNTQTAFCDISFFEKWVWIAFELDVVFQQIVISYLVLCLVTSIWEIHEIRIVLSVAHCLMQSSFQNPSLNFNYFIYIGVVMNMIRHTKRWRRGLSNLKLARLFIFFKHLM